MRLRKKEEVKDPARMEDVNSGMAAGLPADWRRWAGLDDSRCLLRGTSCSWSCDGGQGEEEGEEEVAALLFNSSSSSWAGFFSVVSWCAPPVYIFKNIGPGFLAVVSKAAFGEWAFGEWALGEWVLSSGRPRRCVGPEHRRFVAGVRESQHDSRYNVRLMVMASLALVECFATPLGTGAVGLPSILHRGDFCPCREEVNDQGGVCLCGGRIEAWRCAVSLLCQLFSSLIFHLMFKHTLGAQTGLEVEL